MAVDLTKMKAGQCGSIIALHGGKGMVLKLEALGVRVGVKVTKVSSQFMNGPIIIKTGNTQVAIGFGMARRVIVEIETQ